jgi:hypothetical protein
MKRYNTMKGNNENLSWMRQKMIKGDSEKEKRGKEKGKKRKK